MVEPQLVKFPVLFLTEVEGVPSAQTSVGLTVLVDVRWLDENAFAASAGK